jgi:hypothetical protein
LQLSQARRKDIYFSLELFLLVLEYFLFLLALSLALVLGTLVDLFLHDGNMKEESTARAQSRQIPYLRQTSFDRVLLLRLRPRSRLKLF